MASKLLAGVALAAALAAPAAATADPVLVKNGRVEATVSSDQMSRLVVLGEKVVEVRKIDDPAGPQILVETSDTTGDVFVAFDGEAVGKTFTLFLITNQGRTIQAVLTPGAVEGQTVQILTEQAPQARMDQRADRRAPYQETVTALMRLMFNSEAPEGVVFRAVNGKPGKAGPFELQVVESYEVAGLRGQVIHLRNASAEEQQVIADSFFVPGVLAVAVTHEALGPNNRGRVFIVEEK
ncbi:type-F conjugative transfer system secretin TraK [Caulobacter sp. 17J65-9]|uniref:TraK domain-containing protein n=1 Tax=Caulobacter sp. 17J65-9 TaxID=2709382 RepID=UPI0013C78D52|nr:type-F conjugative transfer system secretin TraK [Caulobacter sp. 17J65-9]NEX91218.1 hypothetical protein [Caulobacter sp. 17J65-9]